MGTNPFLIGLGSDFYVVLVPLYHALMRYPIFLSFFLVSSLLTNLKASAQDTIVMLNGKRINGTVLEIQETSIKYRIGTNLNDKVRSIKSDRVFAINKSNGEEKIIFKPDTLDEPDFNVSQLRLFIKGEQAAQAGYHNTLNKAAAFAVGVGSSFFSIYGLVGPALYSSIVGSVSPDINKQKNTDPALINVTDYQEGYLSVAQSKKIKNSYIAGMIGFVAGFTAQSIIGNNTKK